MRLPFRRLKVEHSKPPPKKLWKTDGRGITSETGAETVVFIRLANLVVSFYEIVRIVLRREAGVSRTRFGLREPLNVTVVIRGSQIRLVASARLRLQSLA